jgi:hypothetical protein
MIFGVIPTKDAVVIAQTTGSGETFGIKSIKSIHFQARSGDDLGELLQRLVVIFARGDKNRDSTIALLGSSSGRFKSSVEAIIRRGNRRTRGSCERPNCCQGNSREPQKGSWLCAGADVEGPCGGTVQS